MRRKTRPVTRFTVGRLFLLLSPVSLLVKKKQGGGTGPVHTVPWTTAVVPTDPGEDLSVLGTPLVLLLTDVLR